MGGSTAFTCRACGAPTTWWPAGLTCDACGRVEPLEPSAQSVRRRPLRPVFAGDADWAPAAPDELDHQLRCPNCGGGATYGGTLRSSFCPFCAAPVALADVHDSSGRVPVDGLIPFQIDDVAAHRAVREWLSRAYFAPRGVRRQTRATHYARLYLPVLSVDAHLDVDYVSRGSLHSDTGRVAGQVRDVVLSAGSALDQEYLDRFRPWPMHLLVPYRPEYLAGSFCESYDYDLPTIRGLVRAGLRSRGAEMANAALHAERTWGNDPPTLLSWTCRSSQENYRHLLIPMYLVTTRLDERVTQVAVSGIDGSIHAQTPVSYWKTALPLWGLGLLALALLWLKDVLG